MCDATTVLYMLCSKLSFDRHLHVHAANAKATLLTPSSVYQCLSPKIKGEPSMLQCYILHSNHDKYVSFELFVVEMCSIRNIIWAFELYHTLIGSAIRSTSFVLDYDWASLLCLLSWCRFYSPVRFSVVLSLALTEITFQSSAGQSPTIFKFTNRK